MAKLNDCLRYRYSNLGRLTLSPDRQYGLGITIWRICTTHATGLLDEALLLIPYQKLRTGGRFRRAGGGLCPRGTSQNSISGSFLAPPYIARTRLRGTPKFLTRSLSANDAIRTPRPAFLFSAVYTIRKALRVLFSLSIFAKRPRFGLKSQPRSRNPSL